MNLEDSPLTIARIAELEELVDSLRANIDIKAKHIEQLEKENNVLGEDLRKQLHLTDGLSERIRMLRPENSELNKDYEKRLLEAIRVIWIWHGEDGWDIYFEHSPEMKRIRGIK